MTGAARPSSLAVDHRTAGRRSLAVSLALITGYMVAEIIGGIVSGSLALLADAGHMATDAAAIALALAAFWIAGRPPSIERTFGFHRTETLAAMLNALGLWLIAAWISFEAIQRFQHAHSVDGVIMLAVGAGGLAVNLACAWVLRRPAQDSLNVEGAFRHVVADLLGSIGVVIGGFLVFYFGWTVVDSIVGVIIALLILASSWRLLAKVVHVLMEGTPSHLDLEMLCSRLETQEGVTGVHDIHAWTITSGYEALSAHVTADAAAIAEPAAVLGRLRHIVSAEFGITHVTIQLEGTEDGCTEDHHIDHPLPPWLEQHPDGHRYH